MASQGPNDPSSATQLATGSESWTSSSNVFASDDARSQSAVYSDTIITDTLVAKGFGFSVPSGATIDGVTVEIERSKTGVNSIVSDSAVRLVKGGSVTGDNKASGLWPTTDAYASYGGAADLWGSTLTSSDVNSAEFGVSIAAELESDVDHFATARIDHIRMTVHYTESGGGSGSQGNMLAMF